MLKVERTIENVILGLFVGMTLFGFTSLILGWAGFGYFFALVGILGLLFKLAFYLYEKK
ncbi:MAG: hypothetical protein H7Y04_13180 [Verrucomicrobia bacterium]|nr:hypothetical protein [Cytophagales bacterium]